MGRFVVLLLALNITVVLCGLLKDHMSFFCAIFWTMPAAIQACTILILVLVSFLIQFAFVQHAKTNVLRMDGATCGLAVKSYLDRLK